MTAYRRSILCIALVLACLVCLGFSRMSSAQAEDVILGKTTSDKVNVRVGASKSEKLLFQIPEAGYVGKILGETYADQIHWYRVEFLSPEKDNNHYYTGYVNADFFTPLTEAETAAYLESGTTSTPTPIPVADPETGATPTPTPPPANVTDTEAPAGTIGYITNGSGVNLRKGPSKGFGVIKKLNRGDQVTVLTIPSVIDDTTFYRVRHEGDEGFVMSTFLRLAGEADPPSSVVTPTPTPEPEGLWGYVKTTKGGVNLRQTPGGTKIASVGRYEVYPVLLEPIQKNGYTWYFVQVGQMRGYLRGDCVKVVDGPDQPATPTAAPPATPTANPGPTPTGDPGPTPTATGAAPTATPKPGTETPTPPPSEVPTGYLKTTTDKVNLRVSPGGKLASLRVEKAGTILPYYGQPTVKDKVNWYKVFYGKNGFCYIHGGFVTLTDESGNPIATPTPTAAPTATPSGATPAPTTAPVNTGEEATYSTLKIGSTGNAVKNLTTELKNQGYFTGTPTTKYTSAVETAVRKFQQDKGLKVDGIAGPATQHKLYGTVPVGQGDTTNLTMKLYPAEKIDWYTGGIQELWKRGDNYKVYDVYTGIVWWAHRWAGGMHADVEPLTAADTARICKMYGVSKASEITSKKHWQRRPSLVTIGTRTFACSLYGVPHNEDGDTIPDNNMTGQICLHFTNSKIHGSGKVDSGHQEAIQYAWEHAPNGHK